MKRLIIILLFIICPLSYGFAQQIDYKLAGPYEVVARDGQYRSSKGGSERDMKAAWDFALAGKHDEAIRIINAYSETLQRSLLHSYIAFIHSLSRR